MGEGEGVGVGVGEGVGTGVSVGRGGGEGRSGVGETSGACDVTGVSVGVGGAEVEGAVGDGAVVGLWMSGVGVSGDAEHPASRLRPSSRFNERRRPFEDARLHAEAVIMMGISEEWA